MIRAYGSQNVRGDGGRIKIRPYNMIRAYGSQWMRLKKVSTIFNHYLKHAKDTWADSLISRSRIS